MSIIPIITHFYMNKKIKKINHNKSLSTNSYLQGNKICLILGEIE